MTRRGDANDIRFALQAVDGKNGAGLAALQMARSHTQEAGDPEPTGASPHGPSGGDAQMLDQPHRRSHHGDGGTKWRPG